ncbi:MAG TPA: hypothetical protein VKM55_24250 [Candidatus Lokiarchaeia archaeon]|nr:hypothetical protein [Candidatus Lokiarchaeia archaeon]
MEEKTYSFYGFLFGSFVLICMSMYHTNDLNYIWLIVGDALTILAWEVADEYRRKQTTDNKANEALFIRKQGTWEIVSWCCNFVMMVLTVATADFISGTHASAIYAILGLIMSFSGSFYCDIGMMSLDNKSRCNPVTHSFILPFVMWWYAYLVLSYSFGENFLIIFPAMFCLGAASHLILDTLPENAGFIKRFEELFNIKYSPRQIRYVPEDWQHLWLLVSAGILLVCFGFSFPRFYGIDNYTWSLPQSDYLATLATYPYILILIIGFVGIGGFVAGLFLSWQYGMKLSQKPEKKPAAKPEGKDSAELVQVEPSKESKNNEDKSGESTLVNENKEAGSEENSS